MTSFHSARLLAIPLALIAAAGCGGGGGGDQPLPPKITDLSALPDDRAVVLSWTPQGPDVQYALYVSYEPGIDPGIAASVSIAAPPYVHEGLQNGVPVYYVVSAVSSAGAGPPSDEVAATPADQGDPLFKDQWHLFNTGQAGGIPGEDASLREAWTMGLQGDGAFIAIADDGLELLHQDLLPNIAPGASHDYTDGDADPTGGDHGTSCAGLAAARGWNGLGLRGAAPRAKLVGFNFLADPTVSNQADAMVRGLGFVQVSSNSWGPPDNTGDLGPSTAAWREAIERGLAHGRGGLGTIYVIAGGNGHQSTVAGGFGVMDDSNYDAFASFHGVIAVGAVDDRGRRAEYSERGANLLVCAPSAQSGGPPSPLNHKISTVDRTGDAGYNAAGVGFDYDDRSYTRAFDGTSAATPIVSGVVALVLQANPALGWRDVREILATTARRNDLLHTDWTVSPTGHWVNHDYGFGVVDAHAAVTAAASWTPVGPQLVFESAVIEPDLPIPDADATGVSVQIPISGSGIAHLEFVELIFRSDHPFPPDLGIVLASPMTGGPPPFVSVLAEPHDTSQASPQLYENWSFGSTRHLGQSADGDWTLTVADHAAEDAGRVQSVQLILRGR